MTLTCFIRYEIDPFQREEFRSSPLLDVLGPFRGLGGGADLVVGLRVAPKHCNSRDTLHGGVIATLADVALGYVTAFGQDPPRRLLTASLSIEYTGSARVGSRLCGLRAAVYAASGRRLLRHTRQVAHGRTAVYSAAVVRTRSVVCDQRVMLNGYYSAKKYPEHLRRIRFKDPESWTARPVWRC